MAQYVNPNFNSYDKGKTFEENVTANAVITKDVMDNIAKALVQATADTNITVTTGETPGGSIVEGENGAKTMNIVVPTVAGPKGEKGEKGDAGEKGIAGQNGSSVHYSTDVIEEDSTVDSSTLTNSAYVFVNDLVIDADGNIYAVESVDDTTVTVGGKLANIKGGQGEKGEKGDPFAIAATYDSVDAMNAAYASDELAIGSFVMIVSDVEDEDNAKMYVKGQDAYVFVVDLSGATGIKGEKGDAGQAATITIGTVTIGDEPAVVNSGTAQNAVLDFTIPRAKSEELTISLTSSGWDSSAKTQAVTIQGMDADAIVIISIPDTATSDQISAIYAANLTTPTQAENSITFKCNGTVPSIDIPIQVIVLP